MTPDITVEQVCSINRAFRQAQDEGLADDQVTRRLTRCLLAKHPGMEACQAMVKIQKIREALDL